MACKWFPLILVFLSANRGLCDTEYRAGFSAGAESCSDFTNDKFNTESMYLSQMDSEDGAGMMCMEGSIDLNMEIDEGMMVRVRSKGTCECGNQYFKINIDIEKETDAGCEPMMSVAMDICECLKDDDAPWKPIFAAMGIESCPVKADTYTVKNMTVDLSFAKDILCHEYVGEYMCKVKMTDTQRNMISCHDLGMCIVET